MTLIELLVGLAIAGMVAAISVTTLSMVGLAVAWQHTAVRSGDPVWLALAAIARDLRASGEWKGCLGPGNCAGSNAHYAPNAVIADGVRWFVDDSLWRCAPGRDCDRYLEGVVAATFVADVVSVEGHDMRREEFAGQDTEILEVILWVRGGGRYSCTVRKTGRAH
jgi:prepilin-type N-terminal cleavage/methylation domain-containing protein